VEGGIDRHYLLDLELDTEYIKK